MTFSLIARCGRTGQFGSAVVSSSPAVAARCAFARAGVGAVTTQNVTDPRLGPAALDLLARGATAAETVAIVQRTASFVQYRQVTVLGVAGPGAVWSGAQALGVNAQAVGENSLSAGNLLADPGVPQTIVSAFETSDPGLELAERILCALEAGLAAGGEAGPVHSAGMVVVATEAWPLVDLRVDWDEKPLERLRAAWTCWQPQMYDYVNRALRPEQAPSYGVPGDE
ncbi:MAG: DUF1028 domain-containing protein [Acetobacter sp.]|uniref:DUF1028 domain-containing protein n=1 Tax=Acetobacter sp. TaxID=440 RepID=UPI0039E7894A